MNPYLDINWEDPSTSWQAECDALLDYYRVQSHIIENDRLDHKEARPLQVAGISERDSWLSERNAEDWWMWDVYFENTFSQILRTSVTTQLCSRLSEWTAYFCGYMKERRKILVSFRDIKNKGWALDNHLRYLHLIHGGAIDANHTSVHEVRRFFALRNAIIHERQESSANEKFSGWSEVDCADKRIRLADTCVASCERCFTEFVHYLMGSCAAVLSEVR